MTERISLVEAYDNRDVIAQLVRLRDNVDELLNILKDIDPNGDLTNVVTKTGDQTIDGVKTFIGQIVADCDIIQNGAAYETHAEQVYSVNDYIVTRDGQITGLGSGDLSGFHVKKYNGIDDSRLGVDNTGTMRVGDVGSEEPLMTRDEAANLNSGDVLLWDGVNLKAIGQAKDTTPASGSTALVTSDGIYNALTGLLGKTVVVKNLTPLSPSGLTVTNYNSYPGASNVKILDDKIVIVNLCLSISGTYSGSTGWVSLFSNQSDIPSIFSYRTESTPYTFDNALKVYLTSGTAYSQAITMSFVGFKS